MKLLEKLSLRTKIIGTVLLILIMIICGTTYSVIEFRKAYHKSEKIEFKSFASSLSEALAAQMFERYGDVQAFAVNSAVMSMNPEGMSKYLDQYISLYGIYDLILVIHKNGHLISASRHDPTGKKVNVEALKFMDYSKEPWFQAVINGKTTDDKDRALAGTYIEGFIRDELVEKAFGEVRYGSSFSAAIKNENGEIVGVITNRAGSRWFESEVMAEWQNMRDFGLVTPNIVIANENGDVILNHGPEDDKNVVSHDENVLLKTSLKNYEAYGAAEKEQQGFIYAKNTKTGEEEAVGFAKVKESKWPGQLGWSIFVQESKENVAIASTKATWNFIFVMAFNIFIALVFATWVGIIISKSIDHQIRILAGNSMEVSDASKSIAGQATQLSESATEQAAALQETMAAVDEINAMVGKNTESAMRSKEVSTQSRESAERGKHTVESMLNSMNEINQANDEIRDQMDESNRGMSEITSLIGEIGNKTKVINEIVLQTKLLSFNASVEAARAGQAGKGFAVVAEEVGNLAQMSGNAAKEISQLLDQSVQKVNNIAQQTKTKVENLMRQAHEKVAAGSANAQECSHVLNEILNQVSNVDSLVSEIAVASQEQAQGINEISKAVAQMEQVTNQTSSVANESSSSAEKLSSQAQELDSVVQQLVSQIRGGGQTFNFNESSGLTHREVEAPKHAMHGNSKRAPAKVKKHFEPKEGKVLTMKKSTPSGGQPHADQGAVKSAVGSDFTPGADDPGFEE